MEQGCSDICRFLVYLLGFLPQFLMKIMKKSGNVHDADDKKVSSITYRGISFTQLAEEVHS